MRWEEFMIMACLYTRLKIDNMQKSEIMKQNCPKCNSRMEKTDIKLKLARGSFILEGYKCSRCKEGIFTSEQAKQGEKEAMEKGLWGSLWLERKVTTIGNLPAIVIPKDIANQLKIMKGKKVKIGVLDKEIIIKPK